MQGTRLCIQVVSESQFTIGGHGVHSAFVDHVKYLRRIQEAELLVNGRPTATAHIVHAHTVGPYSALMLLASPGARVITAHLTPESLLGSIVGGRTLQRLAGLYLSWFYNQGDIIIAVSDDVKGQLHRLGVRKPTIVIPNLIFSDDLEAAKVRRRDVRSRLGLTDADTLIISVGQLQPRKGVLDFLECARMLPSARFLWVGGPILGRVSSKRQMLQRALEQSSPNVTHTGNVSRLKVYEYLSAADIYVSLAKQETFGLAVLEAAACGLPLVLSDLPAFRSTYGDAAQYGSVQCWSRILDQLISDSTTRRLWAQKALNVAEGLEWSKNGTRLLRLYDSLVAQTGSTQKWMAP